MQFCPANVSQVRGFPRWLRILAVAAVPAAALSSCMVGPNYSQPDVTVQENWIQHRADSKDIGPAPDGYWWKSFRDPVLDRLVEMACDNNLSLQAAGARIFQARAQLNQAKGNLFPQDQALSGQLGYRRLNKGSFDTGYDVLNKLLPSIDPNIFTDQILFSASWEIDF